MSDSPKPIEYFERHVAFSIILSQTTNEVEQLLHVAVRSAPAALEAIEKLIELRRLHLDGEFGKQIKDVVDDGFMFSYLQIVRSDARRSEGAISHL